MGKAGCAPETVIAKIQTDTMQNLFAALKLPNDSLSESLVSFFRYFSLPLKPETLGAARREVLTQTKREAAALALAAAADKGLALEGRALKEYADAIDPVEPRSGDGEKQQSGADGGGGERGRGDERRENMEMGGKTAPSVEEIRKSAAEILEKQPVLDFINRIPGKQGRWMAVPFSFLSGNLELNVSLRVFLGAEAGERLMADVAVRRKSEAQPGEESRWRFLFDRGGQRMEFARTPSDGEKQGRHLAHHLAGLFGLPPESVILRKDIPFFADAKNHLRFIDEEV
jgi:hypothetical protein